MQELHEFRWSDESSEGERQLNLRISDKGDGSYEIQNLDSPDQTCQAPSPEDAVAQFTNLFQRRTMA